MKKFAATGIWMLGAAILGGCSADSRSEGPGIADSELESKLGTSDALRCSSESGKTSVVLVNAGSGKVVLLSLVPAGEVYSVSRRWGTLTASNTSWSWKGIAATGTSTSLSFDSSMKGTYTVGARDTAVTCAKTDASEAASWRIANALEDYAYDIDGIADAITEEFGSSSVKPYTIFAVETSRRSSLALGNTVPGTQGRIPTKPDEYQDQLYDNELGWGGMRAAHSLGGGEDYEEWFQGVSDGVSLADRVTPALGSSVLGFIAREGVTVLEPLVQAKMPYAVELTVGPLTFFLPEAFPR